MIETAHRLKDLGKTLDNLLNQQSDAILNLRLEEADGLQHDLFALHAQISAYALKLADEVINGHTTPQTS